MKKQDWFYREAVQKVLLMQEFLKFLSEKNIDIDILSCCSAGSIVGCLYAIGKKPEEILDFFQSIYFFNWKHFTFNQPGLVSSIIFANYLKPIFRDMKIGDLDKEVRIVATELVSGTEKRFLIKIST